MQGDIAVHGCSWPKILSIHSNPADFNQQGSNSLESISHEPLQPLMVGWKLTAV